MRKQLLDKFRAEKDKMPPEKRTLVLTHFPRFLSLLEEEIYNDESPIWDQVRSLLFTPDPCFASKLHQRFKGYQPALLVLQILHMS